MNRKPYNSKYCKEVKCSKRHGNKCTLDECIRNGAEKWPAYFTDNGILADGDVPESGNGEIPEE